MASVIVVISDTHAGSRLALMNPNTVLHDEDAEGNLIPYHPQMTASQTYLWDFYTQAIEQVRKIAGKMPLYLLHLGDETDGVRYGDHKISNRLSDQVIIAIDVLRPWLEIKTLRLIRLVVGTAAHNFGEGSSAHLICAALRGVVDIHPLYHGVLKIGGVSVDYSHHGSAPNMRRWLNGNLARFYLRDLMMGALMRGENPPDLILRGHVHVHEYLEEGRHSSRICILPSWSMINDHARQSARSPHEITHGLAAFVVDGGKIVDEHRIYKTIDIRREEVYD